MYKFRKVSAICCALVMAVFTFHFGVVLFASFRADKPIHDPIAITKLAFLFGVLNLVLFICYLRHIRIINSAQDFIAKYTNQHGMIVIPSSNKR